MATRQKTNSCKRLDQCAQLLRPIEWKRVVRTLHLSPRQADIVRLLLNGQADKEIASTLGVSFYTVRTHLRKIFARERIGDRLQLVLRIFEVARTSSFSPVANIG